MKVVNPGSVMLFLMLAGMLAARAATPASTPPAPINIDTGRQLFVDDYLIASSTLTRSFHPATLHAQNPVLKPETPIELGVSAGDFPVAAPFDDGAWFDARDRLFKLWYHAGWFDGNCLATSKDGLTWERPALDVTPGTNRILPVRQNAEGKRLTRDATTVWIDPAAPAAERYKMFVYSRRLLPKDHGELFTSPDGVHWGAPLALNFAHGDNSSFFYDPFRKLWIFSTRITGKSWSGRSVRARGWLARPRFQDFAQAKTEEVEPWLIADKLDLPDPAIAFEPQLYDFTATPYESLMLGVYGIFRGPENPVAAKEKRPKTIDLELGFSRDGRHYERPTREPFLASSRQVGAWNRGYLHPASGVCCVVGDQLYFYFGAWSGISPKLGNQMYSGASTGLATLRRDGFASLDAAAGAPATLTTRPVVFAGKYLFVNIDAPAGELRAEVLDAQGKPLAPFTLANCDAVKVDSTHQRIQWRGAADLATLAGKPVQFRFTLTGGKLYSFWVSPASSGASHGYVAAGGPGFSGPTDTVGDGR